MSQEERPLPSRESGFTLIEALIAMIILVFGLVAIANLFVVAMSSNQIANYTTVAAAQGSEIMEKLKSVPFTQLTASTTCNYTYTATDPWNDAAWSNDVPGINNDAPPTTTNPYLPVITSTGLQCNVRKSIPGIGTVVTRWKIIDPGAGGTAVRFILVRSEVQGFLGRGTQARFTTFRACVSPGCPGI